MSDASISSRRRRVARRQTIDSNPCTRRRRPLTGRLLFLSCIGAVLFSYGMAYRGVYRLRVQLAAVDREIVVWKQKNHDLERKVQYLKSDEYVESIARRELGLVKKGEVLVIMSGKKDGSKQYQ
jgi:cell division protein DivIC